MGLPFRMNKIAIKIRSLNTSGTFVDPDFREPNRSKVFDQAVTLMGQVNFGSKAFEDRERTHTGDSEPSAGWLVFRIEDLEAASFEPKKGDRVIEIAGRPMNLEVRQVRPESPHWSTGKFLLLYVILEEVKEERASV